MYKMYLYHFIKVQFIFMLLIGLAGCNKLVEVPPPNTKLTGAVVYNSDGTAASILTGLYTKMGYSQFSPGVVSLNVSSGLLADELQTIPGNPNIKAIQPSYTNQLFAMRGGIDYCTPLYNYIYITNSAIENLTVSTGLTPALRQNLLGEAKFCRAFCFFYLVNMYGPVPLPTTSDYIKNSLMPQSPVAEVYKQIINDLIDAQQFLSENYLAGDALSISTERLRPNKGAATALLARAYLYSGEWAKSEEQASKLINDSTKYHLTGLNDVFLKTSPEVIWQLQAMNQISGTDDAALFLLPSEGPNVLQPYFISSFLRQAFEPGDQRSVNWMKNVEANGTTYYYPFKYKEKPNMELIPTNEALTVLRLGEQFLIRAEARALQGNIEGAADDLNEIRNRSGLAATTATNSTELLRAILHERQVELFLEFGHRWLDLKRTESIDSVMQTVTPAKGGSGWQSYQQWLPFNIDLLNANAAMVQNEGY